MGPRFGPQNVQLVCPEQARQLKELTVAHEELRGRHATSEKDSGVRLESEEEEGFCKIWSVELRCLIRGSKLET